MTHQEYEEHLSIIEQLIRVDFDQPSAEFDELMEISEQVWEYEEMIYGD